MMPLDPHLVVKEFEMSDIIQVSDFQEDVVVTSRRLPVLVDFWAEWCTPCKSLFRVLEDMVEEGGGSFLLAKLDVEANRELATSLGVEALPALKLYREGEAIEGMAGTIAKIQVRAFLSRNIPGWDGAAEKR